MATKTNKQNRAKSGKQRGTVGANIFEQVEKMVAGKTMNRAEAFRALAKKTGRNEGTVSANYYRVARLRRKQLRARSGRRAKPIGGKRTAASLSARRTSGTRRGTVGTETFARIEKMVAKENVSRAKAFKKLAAQTGRHEGTVAANYYRVARQKREGRTGARGAPAGNATIAVLRRAVAAVQELAALVERQEAELAKLRKENARFEAVRKLVGNV